MQPAEHLCPSGFRVSGPPGPGGAWGGGQTCIQTFPGQVGMCMQNFIKIGAGVWISISPPRTKHMHAHFYIFRFNNLGLGRHLSTLN